jgi:hypothetical protein
MRQCWVSPVGSFFPQTTRLGSRVWGLCFILEEKTRVSVLTEEVSRGSLPRPGNACQGAGRLPFAGLCIRIPIWRGEMGLCYPGWRGGDCLWRVPPVCLGPLEMGCRL